MSISNETYVFVELTEQDIIFKYKLNGLEQNASQSIESFSESIANISICKKMVTDPDGYSHYVLQITLNKTNIVNAQEASEPETLLQNVTMITSIYTQGDDSNVLAKDFHFSSNPNGKSLIIVSDYK